MKFCITIFSLFLSLSLFAQSGFLAVNNDFRFKDGIYFSLTELLNNQPTLLWDEIEADEFINRKKFDARIGNIRKKSNGEAIPIHQIFGFTSQGLPFIQISELKPNTEGDFGFFVAFKIRGAVSYLSYAMEEIQPIEMNAFNPVTGIPFRKGKIDKTVEINVRKILNFSTGQFLDLTKENLLRWTSHDKEYKNYITNLEEDNLFQAIILYNERHPFYIENRRQ
jgi:hypothetical protein